ncbi:retrovirus-related pol polyprotein from transposon TNT 1-94 [Tanacetum coccineum]
MCTTLQLLVNKEMVKGLPIIKEREHTCEGCPLGKQARKSFLVAQANRAKEKLELVHADICGLMKTDSYAGKNQSYRKLKVLRTDRGGEFLSKDFSRFCEKGTYSSLYTRTERYSGAKNRTIVDMARCMLKAKNLEDAFWAEAVATAVYLTNIRNRVYCRLIFYRRNSSLPSCVVKESVGRLESDTRTCNCHLLRQQVSSCYDKKPVLYARTKHIDIKHHFIQELVAEHIVSVTSCRTNDHQTYLLRRFQELSLRIFEIGCSLPTLNQRGMLKNKSSQNKSSQ